MHVVRLNSKTKMFENSINYILKSISSTGLCQFVYIRCVSCRDQNTGVIQELVTMTK